MKRLVSKSAEITVNLGDMQFIKLRSGVEESFESDTENGFVDKDAQLWKAVSDDLKIGLLSTLEALKKKTESVDKLADTAAKKLGTRTTEDMVAKIKESNTQPADNSTQST